MQETTGERWTMNSWCSHVIASTDEMKTEKFTIDSGTRQMNEIKLFDIILPLHISSGISLSIIYLLYFSFILIASELMYCSKPNECVNMDTQ